MIRILTICIALSTSIAAMAEQPLLVPVKRMSLETANRIAQATIDACRKEGVQIAVAVLNRDGRQQVVMRDVLAADVTVDIATGKAYTAFSFNAVTSTLVDRAGKSHLKEVSHFMFLAGGVPVLAGGQQVGAVGVSGAPSGKTDEKCAKAGVKAVQEDLDFS